MRVERIAAALAGFPAELQLVVALLAARAAPDPSETRAAELLDGPIDWDLFLHSLDRHDVVPLVHRTMPPSCRTRLPARVARRLAVHDVYNAARAARQVNEVIRLTARLRAQDIPVTVLKGAVLSADLYGDPATRQVGDIDLFVPAPSVRRADAVLRDNGYGGAGEAPRYTEAQVRAILRHGHGFHYEADWIVDLQGQPDWLGAASGTDALAAFPGADALRTFSGDVRLLYLCVHGAKHGWSSLKWLADIDQALRHDRALDWDRLRDLSHETGAERMVTQALLLATTLLGSPLPADPRWQARMRRLPTGLVDVPLRYMASHDARVAARPSGHVSHKWYRSRLRTGAGRLGYLLRVAGPTRADWETLPLPGALFGLYYALRPVLWLWRKGRHLDRASDGPLLP